ncbi:transporter [Mesorhizobium sp. CO1-1-8]|uniref:transporter n=1 Tax=Mesorhizobium sp. CO1-1-8 TaxID=2876631 RepID=UPI001CD10291|nr:transporter [Mesorhizobium sp. CO1-1-8]MBZ9772482.1 transporter [Mesorhizobium sp. CO1-1-8]
MKKLTLGLIAAAALPSTAWAFDIAPGDYFVPPPGTNGALLYTQYGHASSANSSAFGGDLPKSKLDAAVAFGRVVHYGELGGVPFAVNAIIPVGHLDVDLFGAPPAGGIKDGLGDITVSAVAWLAHSNEPTGTTLGFTGYLNIPTGAYNADPTAVSLGSGAWAFTPQVGLMQGLGNGFFFDGAFDATFEFDHDGYSRDTSYQAQAYLRYQLSQVTSVSFGYSGKFGGALSFGDNYTGFKTRSDQLRLFASHFFTSTFQAQAMVGSDVKTEDGFKNDVVVQLRFLKLF